MHFHSHAAYGHATSRRGQRGRRPFPLVNVQEDNQRITLEVIAPGRKKEKFRIEVKGRTLTVASDLETSLSGGYRAAEFKLVPFQRSFRLIEEYDTDRIEARYTDGVLYVTLPKKEADPEQPVKSIVVG